MATRRDHRRSTLQRLSTAATECFGECGVDATVDMIADRAGVSRRTVFRYVDSKEDLAFIHPVLWLDVFDDALVASEHEPSSDRLRSAIRAVCDHIDHDPTPVADAMRVALAVPALMRGYADASHRWVERIAQEVRSAGGQDAARRAPVIGAAVMASIDVALTEWLQDDHRVPLSTLVNDGLTFLEPLLDTTD